MANINKMDFDAIFAEYFPLFRGQASSIPTSGDAEYKIAMVLANNAIRKWDRADGTEWPELWETALVDGTGDTTTSSSTTEYAAPTNMRKPPAYVSLGSNRLPVVNAADAGNFSGTGYCYFTGSANTGYVLHLNTNLDGVAIDYIYLKVPRLITKGTDKPDMSDPNFMIQDMLAARFANERNGFAYKIYKNEATVTLQNMKVEAMSGTRGNSDRMGMDTGWGKQKRNSFDI
jgi:hypothetical protein